MAIRRPISGEPVDAFPRRGVQYDFSPVADGKVYLLRSGRDFDVRPATLAAAGRRWARLHDRRLLTSTLFDDRPPRDPARETLGLYVQFVAR